MAERRTNRTEEVTYTIDITKSNLPKWTQLRKLKGSGDDADSAGHGFFFQDLHAWTDPPVCATGCAAAGDGSPQAPDQTRV